ncbi:MAG: thioredoxin fold domain-containing protein [Alphaproteobacteria bacterium]|nr:thioredoxin fold domain-containing protein [Alphaproteobacteria bacterium]
MGHGRILFERGTPGRNRLGGFATVSRARVAILALGLLLIAALPVEASELLPQPTVGADGFWVADWFHPTTGDLRRDLAAASAEGKILAVFWEAEGCQYCTKMHLTSLRDPDVRAYINHRFYVVRLDRYGSELIIDFDGETRTQAATSAHHHVVGTPAIEFRLADGEEVFRLPGFAQPAIFRAVFEYVHTGGYLSANIMDWLRAKRLF